MAKITVKSALPTNEDGSAPVAIFDKDEAHEGGELYIADDEEHSVEHTGGVQLAINEGRLINLDADDDDDDAEASTSKSSPAPSAAAKKK